MKKLHLLSLAVISATLIFASCSNGAKAKEVKLSNEMDSINYALGVINGEGIKMSYFQNDSTGKGLSVFIKALEEEFNASKKDELFNYGKQIGSMLKQQKKSGLMYDSTIVFKEELIIQGIINGIKGFEEGLSSHDAQMYLQNTIQKRQEKNQPPMPIEEQEDNDSVESEG